MAGEHDATEFIDPDFVVAKVPYTAPAPARPAIYSPDPQRAPNREEVDRKVVAAQQKLAELKRAQEELERERSSLEELRRRQSEFTTGRQEMIQHLTRGIGLLEKTEFTARRDAEQMARTITDFRAVLGKVSAIREEAWSKDNFPIELTRGLTAVENARLEWNSARLKLPVLADEAPPGAAAPEPVSAATLAALPFADLCKLGLAFTLPLVVVGLLVLGALALLLRHH